MAWDRISQWEIEERPGCVVLTLRGDGSVTPLMVTGWTLDDLETVMREADGGTTGPAAAADAGRRGGAAAAVLPDGARGAGRRCPSSRRAARRRGRHAGAASGSRSWPSCCWASWPPR